MKNILLISAVFCTIIMSACNNNRNDSNTLKKQDKQTAVNPIAEKGRTISDTNDTPEIFVETCPFDDLQISYAEFDSAMVQLSNYEYIISEREPNATDTAIFLEWIRNNSAFITIENINECSYYTFEGYDFIQLGVGDFCCTRLHDDTTYMSPCNIHLNTDNFIGGTTYNESYSDTEEPAYIYIYNLDYITMKVGKPYIYKTTPKWSPCYKYEFWGKDGWFYIEGYDYETKQYVYHKVRPKELSTL